jgi:hypothetical protein
MSNLDMTLFATIYLLLPSTELRQFSATVAAGRGTWRALLRLCRSSRHVGMAGHARIARANMLKTLTRKAYGARLRRVAITAMATATVVMANRAPQLKATHRLPGVAAGRGRIGSRS